MINFQKINPHAVEICKKLNNAGFQAFIVGGCVRDLLLNKIPKDWDIATDASPTKVMEIFPKHYPTGLQHGTITVSSETKVPELFEITTFRIEGEYKDGRRPEEVFFVMNIEQDLARRDFTINAMAYDPLFGKLIDPFNGQLDLQNKIIKAVGDPQIRFQEDGLRIMRAARFAARFGYLIEKNTMNSISNNLDTLQKVSKERISDELCKILLTNNPYYGLNILHHTGVLNIILPYLTDNPKNLSYLINLNKCNGNLSTKLALLYCNCDINKAKEEFINLKFSNKDIKRICFLLEILQRYYIFSQKDNNLAYRSFMAVIKNHSPDNSLITIEQFIILTEAIGLPSKMLFDKYKDEIVFSKKEMQINGHNLLNLGMSGSQIKLLLDLCYLEILKNPENNNKEYLINFAQNKKGTYSFP